MNLANAVGSENPVGHSEVEAALTELRAKMLGTLRRRGVDRDLAEDLTQESLARVWTRFHQVRDPSRLDAWARTIVLNRLRTYLRQCSINEPIPDDEEIPEPNLRESQQLDEAKKVVRRLLAILGPKQRASIVMRHQDGMSMEAIARVLGMTSDDLRGCLHSAMTRLRRHGQKLLGTTEVRVLGLWL